MPKRPLETDDPMVLRIVIPKTGLSTNDDDPVNFVQHGSGIVTDGTSMYFERHGSQSHDPNVDYIDYGDNSWREVFTQRVLIAARRFFNREKATIASCLYVGDEHMQTVGYYDHNVEKVLLTDVEAIHTWVTLEVAPTARRCTPIYLYQQAIKNGGKWTTANGKLWFRLSTKKLSEDDGCYASLRDLSCAKNPRSWDSIYYVEVDHIFIWSIALWLDNDNTPWYCQHLNDEPFLAGYTIRSSFRQQLINHHAEQERGSAYEAEFARRATRNYIEQSFHAKQLLLGKTNKRFTRGNGK